VITAVNPVQTCLEHYEQIAQPFEWRVTRDVLDRLLERLDTTALAA
jgi:hypothetical protein